VWKRIKNSFLLRRPQGGISTEKIEEECRVMKKHIKNESFRHMSRTKKGRVSDHPDCKKFIR